MIKFYFIWSIVSLWALLHNLSLSLRELFCVDLFIYIRMNMHWTITQRWSLVCIWYKDNLFLNFENPFFYLQIQYAYFVIHLTHFLTILSSVFVLIYTLLEIVSSFLYEAMPITEEFFKHPFFLKLNWFPFIFDIN